VSGTSTFLGNVSIGTTTATDKLTIVGGGVVANTPTTPTLTGTYNTAGNAYRVTISGRYAYVADEGLGLQIIDISNPATPTLVGTYDTSGNALGITISGRYAYVADYGSGLHIIDISNPSTPTLVGTYNTTGNAWGVTISGRYAYVGDYTSGLQIIDISNPATPTLVGTYDTSGNARGITISGRYAYVADYGSGLQIIDISNPASPTLVSTLDTTGLAQGIAINGRYAYVADYGSGLQIIDISNPATPTLVGTYDTSGNALGVTISGRYAYVADYGSGLQIIDINGSEFSSAFAGSFGSTVASIDTDLLVGNQATIQGGLNVGNNAAIGGSITITGTASSSLLAAGTHTALAVLSGNVGIGTSTATSRLQVSGSGGTGGSDIGILNTVSNKLWTMRNTDIGSFSVRNDTDGFEAMTIDSAGNIGVGISPSSASLFSINRDSIVSSGSMYNLQVTGIQSVANANTYYAIDSNPEYSASSGILGAMLGVRGLPQNIGNGTISTMSGVMGQPQNTSGGLVTSMRGLVSSPLNSGSGTTTTMYGVLSQPRASDGNVTSMYGFYADCGASGASATVTSCFGLRVTSPILTGALTNAYGIYVDTNDIVLDNDGAGDFASTTSGSLFIGESQDLAMYHNGIDSYLTNKTGDFYVTGTAAQNVLLSTNGGNVGIGTSTPTSKLTVFGDTSIIGDSLFMISSTSGTVSVEIASHGATTVGPDIFFSGSALLTTESSFHIGLDSDNSGIGSEFRIYANTNIATGTHVFSVNESGEIYFTPVVGTATKALCHDGSGPSLLMDCSGTPVADYAEAYAVTSDVDFGEIVMTTPEMITQTDGEKTPRLTRATMGGNVVGITSNNYGDFTSTGHTAFDSSTPAKPVALNGRVPVKVSLEAGPISIGDSITLSSTAGTGKKATKTGETVVGVALANYTTQTASGTVLVFVQNKQHQTIADLARAGLFATDLNASSTIFDTLTSDTTDTIWSRLTKLAQGFVDGVLNVAGVKTSQVCLSDNAGETCIDRSILNGLLQQNDVAPQTNNTPVIVSNTTDTTPGTSTDDTSSTTDTTAPPTESDTTTATSTTPQ
jgi:hypothetical protein